LLKELARKHTIANPELTCFVTNYYPRPELKIRSKRSPMVTLTYSEAVVRMPHHLSNEFLVELYQYARSVLPDEEIVERFLVISPDLLKPGPGAADTSAQDSSMSPEEHQAAQAHPMEVESEQESTAEPEQGTSNGFSEVTKKIKNKHLKDKRKSTPYSKNT